MKYIKMMGLAVVAAMALASTASATVLEGSGGNLPKGTLVEMTGTNAVIKAGFSTVECSHSELDWKTSNAGGAGETVEGNINGLKYSGCNMTVTVFKTGKIIVHHTSGSNGSVTSEGAEMTVNNHSISCTYGTPNATPIGTISGGGPALLEGEALLARVAGGFLCAQTGQWSNRHIATTPVPLYVTAS